MTDTPNLTKLYRMLDQPNKRILSLAVDEIERRTYSATRDDLLMHFAKWLDNKKMTRKAIREETQRLIDKPQPEITTTE